MRNLECSGVEEEEIGLDLPDKSNLEVRVRHASRNEDFAKKPNSLVVLFKKKIKA